MKVIDAMMLKLTLLVTGLVLFVVVHPVSSMTDSSSSSISSTIPRTTSTKWDEEESPLEIADLEQRVEDYNAKWIASNDNHATACTHRRLVCLPISDKFNPPMGMFSHDHVQTGDKMSVPRNYWTAIERTKAEVPWLMKVERVAGWTKERFSTKVQQQRNKEEDQNEDTDIDDDNEDASDDKLIDPIFQPGTLDVVVGSLIDCRAPSNYCFLPWWMMRALGLHPRDVVDVTLTEEIPPGSTVKLRPHSSDFSRDITNPQAVLETELKHYSSLTKGSIIAFDYNHKRYWFDVVELRSSPRGERCDMVKVMDCNLSTDFLPARDTLKQTKKSSSRARVD